MREPSYKQIERFWTEHARDYCFRAVSMPAPCSNNDLLFVISYFEDPCCNHRRPCFRVHKVHERWCFDGIDGDEALWRLDLADDLQIQLFAVVCNEEERDLLSPRYYEFRLFIERDKRELVGSPGRENSKRVDYACHSWSGIPFHKGLAALAAPPAEVAKMLADEIDHVRSLPRDPRYCDAESWDDSDTAEAADCGWRLVTDMEAGGYLGIGKVDATAAFPNDLAAQRAVYFDALRADSAYDTERKAMRILQKCAPEVYARIIQDGYQEAINHAGADNQVSHQGRRRTPPAKEETCHT